MMQGTFALHQNLSGMIQSDAAQRRADELAQYMEDAVPSGRLGDGRLAVRDDLLKAGLLGDKGLIIGGFGNELIRYNGDSPLVTFLKTGGGKGRDYILPTLGLVDDRSIVIFDPKNGENYYATHEHRENTLGIPSIVIDPYHVRGNISVGINILDILPRIVQSSGEIQNEPEQISLILIPRNYKSRDGAWADDGGRRLLSLWMEGLAHFDAENCNLGGLWMKANCSEAEMALNLTMLETCGIEGLARRASSLKAEFETVPKQFYAYISSCQTALSSFEKGKTLDHASRQTDFDFRRLKHEPHTVWFILPSDKIDVSAPFISLCLNYIIETVANETGKITTTLLLDEMPQLPPIPSLLKALRLYRGCGVQPWMFAQSRYSFDGKYSESEVREFIEQSAVVTYKHVAQPEIIRDLTLLSGNMTIFSHGNNHSGGKLEVASASMSETKRPVLQAEQILALGEKQILKVSGLAHLVIADTTPFYKIRPLDTALKDTRKLHRGE
jgi:type IV secretion system protein VirD4